MKEPFRPGRLQAGLGAPVDAYPPESPLCSSGARRRLGSFVALERAEPTISVANWRPEVPGRGSQPASEPAYSRVWSVRCGR